MSEVYYLERTTVESIPFMDRLYKMLKRLPLKESISENDHVALKLHFGEPGITSFLRPIYIKPFTDEVKRLKALPFLTDANTLYKGMRSNAVEHIFAAISNGFSYTSCGAPVIIADGLNSEDYVDVEVKAEYYDKVRIAGEAHRASSMLVLTHFKGHEMTGFGGAIKNIGMGLANKYGKLSMHSTSKPFVKESACRQCSVCVKWCQASAIRQEKGSPAHIDENLCTGCCQCIMSCPHKAINLKWDIDFSEGQCKMAEYALGVVKPKKNKIWFFNFLLDITPDCDCFRYSDIPIVPDLGILASTDPVAIDKASFDLVNNAEPVSAARASTAKPGEDKFKTVHPHSNAEVIFKHAEKIGLGESCYKLIKI